MHTIKVKLTRLSVCPCGFPLLKESIPLGTEYFVDPDNLLPMTFICGGCHKEIRVIGIYVHTRQGSEGGYLPIRAFDLKLEQQTKKG